MTETSSSVKGPEKFLVIPILVLVMAQIGTTGENSAMSLAATAFANAFGSTTADFQLANMVYSLVAGALMIAGGMMGIIIGWKKNFRLGILLCAAGEVVVALSPSMLLLTWVGRVLVGLGASFMIIFTIVAKIELSRLAVSVPPQVSPLFCLSFSAYLWTHWAFALRLASWLRTL